MKTYLIRWRGTITRDVGSVYVNANDLEEAKRIFEANTQTRQIMCVTVFADAPTEGALSD